MQAKILQLLSENYTKREIAEQLGIGYSTVRKWSTGVKSVRPKREFKCTDCGESKPQRFYQSMRSRCKTCHNKLGYEAQKDKIRSYALSRGPLACSRCGYDKSFAALEWHHRDPTEKDPTWNRGWKYDRLKLELDKCDLVCANCHREIHHG